MGTVGDKWDEEYSVIGDKGEVGFIDYADDKSVCSYNPSDEGPVIISVPFAFKDGKPQSIVVGESATDTVTLRNTTGDPIQLWTVSIYASNPEDSFTVSLMEPPSANGDVEAIQGFLESFRLEDRMLQPGETLTVWVSCRPKDIGLHTSILHFDVEDERIERVIFLLAEDKITCSLTSRRPYVKNTRKKQFTVDQYVVGQRPARRQERMIKKRLPRYDIPKDTRDLIESKQVPEAIGEGLTSDNYVSYFHTLLIMEEIQLEDDMRRYDMENVTMKRRNQFLTLEVPDLAERRPSLVHGDFVFVKLATSDANDTCPPYQGFIHHVQSDEVHLKFSEEFHFQHRDLNLYNIQFSYNRINMRRLYQAVEAVSDLDTGFLFLSESFERRLIEPTPIVPISGTLNEEQVSSIEMILGCKGAPPYVIHGPPGTGKTLTLVEAILQVYTTRKDSRILVCAPSNSAADHLLECVIREKNVKIKEHEIFRLNATSRSYEDVKPDFIRFCFFDEQIFKCPPINALKRYKIVISTYMSASLLYAEGIQRGHFSHVFLDEAGQASEPETMVPISNFCESDTVVVLAGDPMQLGPVVHSREAEKYGLGKSYMERLFECPFFCGGDQCYVTTLIRNYRCHPEILSLPSTLFYEGQLIACREDNSTFTSLAKRLPDIFPNNEFPILFYGIQGTDEREGNNPSWFNRFEISRVVDIIKKLTARGNINDEDIGVITPYRHQVMKIKEVLESLEMTDIKVGSVEQFQGQERQVIIVSTVRSTIKHNEFDRVHCLGFLSNPKRFNVSVTRAISSLIIVGNPHIVSKDPYWNRLLYRCSDNSSYKGCSLPEKPMNTFEESTQQASWNYQEDTCPPASEVEWGQEVGPLVDLKPITDGVEWSDGWNCQASEVEWGQEPNPSGGRKQIRDEVEWSDGWNGQETSRNNREDTYPRASEVEGSQEDFLPDDPKPPTDEAEWSDGWKM